MVLYETKEKTRRCSKVILAIEGSGIQAGGTIHWSNEQLPIPATVPCISSCRVLKLSYAVTVTLAIHHASDLEVTIPVTIGNVPFR